VRWPLRLRWLPVVVLALAAGPAHAAPTIVPTASTRVSIDYSGTFDLSNTIVPQGTQHSYVYHVEWAYSWSGTWSELFNEGSAVTTQASFDRSRLVGSMHAVWRNVSTGPIVGCTLRIVPVTGDYPDFSAVYSAARGTLRIDGLESPAGRYGQYVGGSSDPLSMCGGGPDIDIFGQPAGWSPLGPRTIVAQLTAGAHRFDRAWKWTYRFASGFRRLYTSSVHAALLISFPGSG
jgi:hypothetical protein